VNVQRHQARRLAHSYRDELLPSREPAVPLDSWENTWWGIGLQVLILGSLLFGIPFLLWLVAGGVR